jgi:hypothetical protein
MVDKPFELRVVRRGETEYGLALHQQPAASREGSGTNGARHWPLVVQTWGGPLKSVLEQVLSTIKEAGYRSTDLSRNRREPFELAEPAGVRLGLLFLAVKPLRKVTRMNSIAEQVRAMTDEEAYYWFSKATTARTSRRAQRAMRVLLAEE